MKDDVQEPMEPKPPGLDYASVGAKPRRRTATRILGELFCGLVGGAILMFTPLIFPRMHSSVALPISLGLPVVVCLCLMFKRQLRIVGIGFALAPAMFMLAIYAICGR